MSDESTIDDERLADVFGALSDVRRLRALRFIARRQPGGPGADDAVCACDVQDHLDLSQPATSYHMKVLREAGLVAAERRGRWVHYRVSKDGLETLRAFMDGLGDAVAARPLATA